MTSMYNWFVHSKKKINFLSSLTANIWNTIYSVRSPQVKTSFYLLLTAEYT